MAGKPELNLVDLAGYAIAGAVFFLIFAWRLRSQPGTTGTPERRRRSRSTAIEYCA